MNTNQNDFKNKKEILIAEFISKDDDIDDEARDKAFETLCIDLVKLQFGITEISEEKQTRLTQFVKDKMSQMVSDDPELAHAVNGLNRIGKSRYGDASKYVEKLLKVKQDDFSALQAERASKPRQDSLNDLIKSYLRFKPDMTERDVLNRLEADIGKGVVDNIDDDDIYYFPLVKQEEIAVSAKISGLKNRLNRLKKART
jgi:hypothetical protein